jgi:SAM-dependent methyltransferase
MPSFPGPIFCDELIMKIHFGAFNCPVEGWTNTDITPHIYIARVPGLAWFLHTIGKMPADRYQDHQTGAFKKLTYLNVGKPWPYSDETIDAVFSSHVLEHLPIRAARTCISNAYRVLKKGGILRIVVPDLDKCIADYSAPKSYEWAFDVFEANQVAEKNMHHFMYNEASLARLMRDCGFAAVSRQAYREGNCPDIELLDNRPESLFMEAVK